MKLISSVLRVFTWLIVGFLAWDAYYYGTFNSVAVNAGMTLAERVAKASEKLPGLLKTGVDDIHKFLEKRDEVAFQSAFPLPYSTPATPASLSADALWAIELASHRTGISTQYLVTTAFMEANFDAKAQSQTSSAAGMYQIIDSTWLSLMRAHGNDYGWAGYSSEIACAPLKPCKFLGSVDKSKVMDLRYDTMTATFLSAELARSNKRLLEAALERTVSDAELYLAHFLGASGAIQLVQLKGQTPEITAASLFPRAARANKRIFYGSKAHALTCDEFYLNVKERWDANTTKLAVMSRHDASQPVITPDAVPSS